MKDLIILTGLTALDYWDDIKVFLKSYHVQSLKMGVTEPIEVTMLYPKPKGIIHTIENSDKHIENLLLEERRKSIASDLKIKHIARTIADSPKELEMYQFYPCSEYFVWILFSRRT